MITKLFIQNYAIIDEIEIDFHRGLNIITGETGAGKSILVGALSLILGNRADSSALLFSDKKCIVEGHFDAASGAVTQFLKENELDIEDEVVVRREIAVSGKSRGFINDTPVSLVQLRQLASLLVDLHQQFDTMQVGDMGFQRMVLDVLAENESLLRQYSTQYHQWQKAQKKYAQLIEQKANLGKELDYLQFQYAELSELQLSENELETLEQELQTLSHAEDIKSALHELAFVLNNSEQPVSSLLKQLQNKLEKLSSLHSGIADLASRLSSAQIEINDIGEEAGLIAEKTILDEERMQQISDRLAAGYKLMKKHNVSSTEALLQIQAGLQQQLSQFSELEGNEEELMLQMKTAYAHAETIATSISQRRQEQIDFVQKETDRMLAQVGMPNARLKVSVTPVKELTSNGKDEVEFLFDANNSHKFESIRKVASGGELSRLMLSLKSLVASKAQLPTLIFDEIDAGISGEAAKQVGNIMKQLSANLQLIAITHQPQIAGKADAHFFVYKQQKTDGSIKTGIKMLTEKERVNAIAQMIGGENPSEAALANAKELVN